jgi:hypothetical protein
MPGMHSLVPPTAFQCGRSIRSEYAERAHQSSDCTASTNRSTGRFKWCTWCSSIGMAGTASMAGTAWRFRTLAHSVMAHDTQDDTQNGRMRA